MGSFGGIDAPGAVGVPDTFDAPSAPATPGTSVARTPFFDMHCHLDFASNTDEAVRALDAAGAGAFTVRVLPGATETPTVPPTPGSLVKWGVGLHPWWVADGLAGTNELDALVALVAREIYVGEVGLDFGKTHGINREAQLAFFEVIADACGRAGGRVLSIHAVRAADDVLDILERTGTLDTCTCIFHWFSDSSDALARAVRAGCYFSVGELMLRSARGREYARQIPASRLLFETDYPAQGCAYDVAAMQVQLAATCARVADSRGISPEDLAEQVAETSRSLLSCV